MTNLVVEEEKLQLTLKRAQARKHVHRYANMCTGAQTCSGKSTQSLRKV